MSIVEIVALGGGVMALVWLGCGAVVTVVTVVARRRGGGTVPRILQGLLLGPVGFYMILKVMHHQCEHCQRPVLRGVRRCPVCGEEIARLKNNPVGPMWTYRRDW